MTNNVNLPSKWERDYQLGTDGWDIGTSTPVFQRLLREGQFPPGRMLVPCAGRGHDAREFARHGFQVVAVDFAREAIDAMRAAQTPDATHEILRQDVFQLPPEFTEAFDYALEYTCYCAIDPNRRDEYVNTIARVLKPGGIYIALAFPLGDPSPNGPPFSYHADELIEKFRARGFDLLRREFPPDSIKPRQGREELVLLQKRDKIADRAASEK